MNSKYNRNTMTDMPLDASLDTVKSTPKTSSKTTTSKPKINVIGKKTTTAKSGASSRNSTASKRTTPTKSTTKSASSTKATSSRKSLEEIKQATKQKEEAEKKSVKPKSKELESLEKLNEESIKNYQAKSKRNKVLIIILSILLIAAIATIAIYISVTNLKTNCNMYVHGADATYIVDGKEISEFRTPANMQGYCILVIDIKLRINESGEFDIKFQPECFENGVMLENTKVYEVDYDLFYDGEDGYYYSIEPIKGGQTIQICCGVVIDKRYEESLNVNNFRLDFHTYLEKRI